MHSTEFPSQAADAREPAAPPLQWAIVELMGHAKIAGAVSQDNAFGVPMIRVDVPPVVNTEQVYRNGAYVSERREIPAHSRSLAAGAIYSVNWCDEAAARIAAHSIQHTPLRPFALRSVLDSVPETERAQLLALVNESALKGTIVENEDHEHF